MAANFAVDGFGEDARPRDLGSPSPVFLAYQQNIDIAALHLVKLDLVRSMQAQEFDIGQIANSGQFDQFRNIYGVARNQPLQVNLWGPRGTEVPLRTEPIPGRTGMFRLSPQSNMQPGRYALYYRNGLHPNLILNYKGISDEDAVFFLAVNPSSTPSGETSGSGVAQHESYEGLMRSGQQAFRSSAWDEALADFQAAAKEDRTGLAWLWTGNAQLAAGHYADFGSAWNEALKLNRPLALPVCLAHGISQCQVGTLEVGRATVRFLSAGRTIFESAPTGIVPQESIQHNVAGYADFKLEIAGKKYNLIFMPYGVECQVLAHVNCRGSGTAQQKAVGDYVEQALSKLAVP
jgi:tetratricopeptide (TPR) repeat protein